MTDWTSRPFQRRNSRAIRVLGADGLGESIMLEVQAHDWLHAKTDRDQWMWSTRRVGHLGWKASSSPREALPQAAYVLEDKRSGWLSVAVKQARVPRCG